MTKPPASDKPGREIDDPRALDELVRKAESRGIRRLSAEELARLGELYRRVASQLSAARSRRRDLHRVESLNQLVARAHAQVYRPRRRSILRATRHCFTTSLPTTVRGLAGPIQLNFLVLGISAWLGWRFVELDPANYYALVPVEELRSPGASAEELYESLVSGRESGTAERSLFAGMLWQHNTRVALAAFAIGACGSAFALALVAMNGLMLGAMTWVFTSQGLTTSWLAWLAGHGVTELGAIVLAAAAGTSLGLRLLFPGERSRADALRERASQVLPVAAGVVVMLLIAALLESFFRQTAATNSTRFAVAGLSFVLWGAYFALGARPRRSAQTTPSSRISK